MQKDRNKNSSQKCGGEKKKKKNNTKKSESFTEQLLKQKAIERAMQPKTYLLTDRMYVNCMQ